MVKTQKSYNQQKILQVAKEKTLLFKRVTINCQLTSLNDLRLISLGHAEKNIYQLGIHIQQKCLPNVGKVQKAIKIQ